jgi:hypothetical protein
MSRRHILFAALKRLGAFKKKHNRRMNLTLGLHLLNTYDDLTRSGADEEVALAGGLHSIYGTNSFQNATATPGKRVILQKLFGERAERLAWLFGRINRPGCLETGEAKDWRTGERIDLSPEDLRDLRLIEAANLRDNGASLDRYPWLTAAGGEVQVAA